MHLKGRHFPSSCDFLVFTLIYIGCLPWVLGNVVIIAAVSLKRACVAFFDKKHRYLFEGHHLVFTFILPPSLPEQFFFVVFHSFCRFVVGFTKVKLSCPCNFNIPTLSSVNTSLILSAMPLYTIVSTVLGESLSNLYSVSFIDHFFFIRLSKKV